MSEKREAPEDIEELERLLSSDLEPSEMLAVLDAAPALLAELKAHRKFILKTRQFILDQYGLSNMEAHHDGHPIEKDAREIWDDLHDLYPPEQSQ